MRAGPDSHLSQDDKYAVLEKYLAGGVRRRAYRQIRRTPYSPNCRTAAS